MTNISPHGMTDFNLTNRETGEFVMYRALDPECAKMLAAEDHGGEPEDWRTQEEACAEDDE